MNSQPSPGDGLTRFLRWVKDEMKRLAIRDSAMAKKIADLEARVTDLEGP